MIYDKCGVIGIWNSEEASHLAYAGLYALQHRGQESAGIGAGDGENISLHKGMGKVMDVFDEQTLREDLKGAFAIGHTRYSTSGESLALNAQPLCAHLAWGPVALAHNGDITNSEILGRELQKKGALFQTTSDTEVLVALLARRQNLSFEAALEESLVHLEGAFSLVLMEGKRLVGVRDPHGFRPLCLGKKGEAYILASETCALDLIEARFIREIEPGEVIIIDSEGVRSIYPFPSRKEHFCVFELIYFSRPDSLYQGRDILSIRKALGRELAREAPCPEGEVVISIPDSSNPAALGYAEEAGLPFELGLIRNHYVGRTFIEPSQSMRDWRARIKYNPVRPVLEGKTLVVVDDSIVRGTTCERLIRLFREAGAREVHLRISSPIIYHPCHYGIDTPDYEELIGHRLKDEEEIRRHLGADSLHYLSLEGLARVVEETTEITSYCQACFSGDYPLPLPGENREEIEI